jgi:hypothetical protein
MNLAAPLGHAKRVLRTVAPSAPLSYITGIASIARRRLGGIDLQPDGNVMRTLHQTFLRLTIALWALGAIPGAVIAQSNPARPPDNQQLRMPDTPTGNYSFLQGCWVTDAFRHSSAHPLSTSTYCFDAKGQGTLVFQDPTATCRVAASASYQGDKLKLVDSDGRFSDGRRWVADHLDCERRADGVAYCSGFSSDSTTGGSWSWTVTLRRKAER